jgi:hypothetical protein
MTSPPPPRSLTKSLTFSIKITWKHALTLLQKLRLFIEIFWKYGTLLLVRRVLVRCCMSTIETRKPFLGTFSIPTPIFWNLGPPPLFLNTEIFKFDVKQDAIYIWQKISLLECASVVCICDDYTKPQNSDWLEETHKDNNSCKTFTSFTGFGKYEAHLSSCTLWG